ncbi:MAG: hypothetical protein MJY70_00950 [Bacteroidales bacterium]|nr:hypothetical protein [Bacteroidales bacterium]
MKKILSMIALTVLMVALAGSCTKNFEERLDKTDADVATLKAAIGQYEKLQSDITTVLQALRAEVGNRPASEQQSVWNCINALQSQSNAFDAALKALQKLVGETSVDEQISEAVENLVNTYSLDELASTLKSLEEEVARKFDVQSLEKQINQLSKTVREIDYYLARINAFYGLVQSVAILPQYDDGSIKAGGDGLVEFKCVITPASALAGISDAELAKCFTLTLAAVGTEAGESAEITVTSAEADPESGIVKITADISEYIPEDGSQTLMLALNLKLGASNYSTEFVPVYVAGSALPEGALPGEFTVNAADKKVHFSRGNLYWDGDSFELETNQYDFLDSDSWDASHVSHFYWSKDASVAIAATYSDAAASDGDVFFTNATTVTPKSDFTVKGVTGKYRTLSADEWQYLFDTRTVNGGTEEGKSYQGATINSDATTSVYGMILYPDNYTSQTGATSYTSTEWTTMEENGCVFLPAARGRNNSTTVFDDGDWGFYWSSTARGSDKAGYVGFCSSMFLKNSNNRVYAYSVRLVTE